MNANAAQRLWRLVARPTETWADIAAEPGDPATLLLPLPALLAALGPLAFIIGHGLIATDAAAVPLGSALAFSAVYYALLVLSLVGQAALLGRLGPVLGCRVSGEESLKLSVHGSSPFLISGIVLILPLDGWPGAAVLAALLAQIWGGLLIYQGLGVLSRAEGRARGLLAAAAAGGTLTAWILGFFLLSKIIL